MSDARKLADTVDGMLSPDWREREEAEREQLSIRIDRLRRLLVGHLMGALDFELEDPVPLLRTQLRAMETYLSALDARRGL